ncbi:MULTISPECIES: Spy/CpxP family protein refolding chaperone [unclassified Acidovorax]|uniref:Spy/CpxP family protein refolding chaperone n=1 Tax=unclassified Acidovorax TaxID=2684926 RepID=UPI0028832B7A|nr:MULTISPECIES: Spy/CpxP family protein refolding chaperone [unclassified Acidovorax]
MANIFQQRLASTTLATALLVAMAAPAFAQTAAPVAPAQTATPAATDATKPARPNDRRGPPSPEERKDRMALHATALKQKLQLTPAQEPAWTAFTASMQPPAGGPGRMEEHRGLEKLTTPERIDRMKALRAEHAAQADRRGEATKTFYAALTPAQQKVFDTETARQHHGGPRDGRGPGAKHRDPQARGEHGHGPRHGKPVTGAPTAPGAPTTTPAPQ